MFFRESSCRCMSQVSVRHIRRPIKVAKEEYLVRIESVNLTYRLVE
jgi:hypothetical protein